MSKHDNNSIQATQEGRLFITTKNFFNQQAVQEQIKALKKSPINEEIQENKAARKAKKESKPEKESQPEKD